MPTQMLPSMGLQMQDQHLAQQHQVQQQLMHRQLAAEQQQQQQQQHNAVETQRGLFGGMAQGLQLPIMSTAASNGMPAGNVMGSNMLPGLVQGAASFVSDASPNFGDMKEEQPLSNGM